MPNRKREVRKVFRVTPEEEKLLALNMDKAGFNCFSKYAREMLMNGEINVVSHFEKESIKLLLIEYRRVGNNINQIAKVANSSGKVFRSELEAMLKEKQLISNLLRELLKIHQSGSN